MKITVVGRQLTVRQSMKELIEKKLGKLDKFFDKEIEATVTLSCKRTLKNLEVTISAQNTLFRSENEAETFETALDLCIDAIVGQIRRNKTRLEKRLRVDSFEGEFEEDIEEEPEFRIRVKEFSFKPMSVEEAILQMNLLGHQFFVFEDDHSGDTCVVYVRRDGDYGLIVPSK